VHRHRRIAIAGGRSTAKALVEVLTAEIVDEESVGGLDLAVLEEDTHARPRLQAVDGDPGARQPLGTAIGAVTPDFKLITARADDGRPSPTAPGGAASVGRLQRPRDVVFLVCLLVSPAAPAAAPSAHLG
jgi:hypothetical protein